MHHLKSLGWGDRGYPGDLRTETGALHVEIFPHVEMGGCFQKQGEWTLDLQDKTGRKNNESQKRGYDQRALGV